MISNALGFIPQNLPSLNLDFMQGVLNPALSFSRNSEATYFDSSGVMRTAAVNQPRLDYDPITKQALGLLFEEQRTNLLTYSSSFTNWLQTGSTTTLLSGTTLGLSRYGIASVGQGWHRAESNDLTLTSGIAYSGFILCENTGTSGQIRIVFRLNGPATETILSGQFGSLFISTNAGGSGSLTFTEKVISPTIRKISFVYTPNTTGTGYRVGIGANSVISGQTVVVLAAQFEQGSFDTSLIPTTTTAVTRSADFCSMPIGSWFNANEGSFYSEATTLATTGFPGVFVLSAGSTGNSMGIFFTASPTLVAPYFKVSINGSSSTIPSSGTLPIGTLLKMASAYNSTTGFLVRNGGAVVNQAITLPSQALTSVKIGAFDAPLNGWMRKLTYYPRRLSNTYLQALTL